MPFYPVESCELATVPTVSGLIKAGDEGLFTYAMFDWIPSNYEEVYWKPMYEAFMAELLWHGVSKGPDSLHLPGNFPKRHRQNLQRYFDWTAESLSDFQKQSLEQMAELAG